MSVTLKAPASSPETTTILPNPQVADVENSQKQLTMKRAMDDTTRTYVKRTPTRLLTYTFRLSRLKMIEMQEFVRSYHSSSILMENHKGETWTVNFVSNPFDFGIDGADNEGVLTINLEGVNNG